MKGRQMNKWRNPMTLIAVAVCIGIAGIVAALLVSVFRGGPPDSLSEGVFAVLAAAIGAVAGYSVADHNYPKQPAPQLDAWPDEPDDLDLELEGYDGQPQGPDESAPPEVVEELGSDGTPNQRGKHGPQ